MFASKEDTPFLEYVGQDGYSQPCVDAVIRLLLAGHRFEEAVIVTHNRTEHAFVLYAFGEPQFVVHSGFTSDSGEGSSAFRRVASLLSAFGARLDESEADERVWSRLAQRKLTFEDLHQLRRGVAGKFGLRFLGILKSDVPDARTLDEFPPAVPWAILDPRLADLALGLLGDLDSALREGFSRLEAAIRTKANAASYGTVLIDSAFRGRASALNWPDVPQKQSDARAELFRAAFKAYRDPLAHGVSTRDVSQKQKLSNFLLLNHLFRLEDEAKPRI